MEKSFLDEELPEHPIFNRTGVIVLLFILLMSVIFMWDRDRRNCLTPAERDYEDFKAEQQWDDANF